MPAVQHAEPFVSRRRGWIALLAMTVTGTATAGILTLQTSDSAPLRGRFPGDTGPAAGSYAITLHPDLQTGRTGWCFDVAYQEGPQGASRGSGCSPAPGDRSPLIVQSADLLAG